MDTGSYLMGAREAVVGTGMLSFIRLGTAAEEESPAVDEVISSSSESVVLFVSGACPYCADAMAALTRSGVPFHSVEATAAQRRELTEKTGQSSVPSAWVKGTFIGGANDGPEEWMGVTTCLRSGKLGEMLKSD